jgi:AbrB family looped-hinge helix DNA binding protein
MPLVEIRSATITEKGQVAIPKGVRNIRGFRIGSKVAILAFDDHLELRPMSQISEGMATALASERALARDWSSATEEKAWRRLPKGR